MRRRMVALLGVAAIAAAAFGTAGAGEGTGVFRAGVAVADISWHVGAPQGQYNEDGNTLTSDKYDPYVHGVKSVPTDGMQARMTARAIVLEGPDGTRAAYVGHDLYLQQDMLQRRVAQLVEEAGVGIDREHLMMGASHNHSAPYATTLSWGVWLFADYFDFRQFDYVARRIADKVIEAAHDLRPARVGASVGRLDEVQRNILGPAVADDGTPAGFPYDYFDTDLAVIRLDDVSDPGAPRPLAALVNLGMHPESLNAVLMTSPDFVGMVERLAGRATGATVVWSQGAVGDIEPDQSARAHRPEEKREYWHRDYAQAERMSRVIADRVADTWGDVASGTPEDAARFVPFSTDAPVQMLDMTFPGPASHPLPTVSNCRTSQTARGDIRVPLAGGPPDCASSKNEGLEGPDLTEAYEALKDAGVPVPANYGVPSTGGAQETTNAHLQVLRIGEIVLGSCPCEPITDMVRNFKSRANRGTADLHVGFDWPCSQKDDSTYTCDYRRSAWRNPDLRDVSKEKFDHMHAQIHNDAAGWDAEDPASILAAEAEEPDDPALIKGNFTHEEIQDLDCNGSPCEGFTLPLMVGQANDYIGYVVTYREYQRGDHYRKSLTAYGPHTADYVTSRLVRMASILRGGAGPSDEILAAKVAAEHAAHTAKMTAMGNAAFAAVTAYEAALPDDGGAPEILAAPDDGVERFTGAQLRWRGGSNYTDNPVVTVERKSGDDWTTAATQHGGEIPVTFAYHALSDPQTEVSWLAGELENVWTATWEVFDQTPVGTYRFRVAGRHRDGLAPRDYTLESAPFEVRPWSGIQVTGGSYDPATGTARFTVGAPDYPDTYQPVGVPYISPNLSSTETGTYCFRCTFRPWAATGAIVSARVTVIRLHGAPKTYSATLQGGEWVATDLKTKAGDTVAVAAGDVLDEFGNVNGEAFSLS